MLTDNDYTKGGQVMTRSKKRICTVTVSIIAVLALLIGACAIYLADYYRADEGAIAAFSPEDNISVSVLDNGSVVFEPQGATAGFIFYPGGKVEHDAYQPLMEALAREGILCVLVKMPFNLAVFNVNAADGIQAQFPHVEDWYIGGHSLGGSMAASYLADHVKEYEGLILLGSYSTADLSGTSLKVLSIYGSEDKVLNREKYDESSPNLPNGFTEIVIEGGCHAYFGMYGAQDGDGTPTIANHEQINLTAEHILKVMK
jgi:hypothetical protein